MFRDTILDNGLSATRQREDEGNPTTNLIINERALLRYALHDELVLELQIVECEHGVIILVDVGRLAVPLSARKVSKLFRKNRQLGL